jgi:hypothetical protein
MSIIAVGGAAALVAGATWWGVREYRRARFEAGLVQFQADGKPLAFALKPYEAFAAALGEAARRTLEDPVEWLGRKKKKTEDGDDDEDSA